MSEDASANPSVPEEEETDAEDTINTADGGKPKAEDPEKPEGEEIDTTTVKCKGCGANMAFDPDLNVLYCPHCGSKEEIKGVSSAEEQDLRTAFSRADRMPENKTTLFFCDNCGAKIVLGKGETALNCPFCGTAHVRKTEELAGLKPNAVLPFSFGADKALEYGKRWAKRRAFAPNKFKKNLSGDNVNGVYTPCFTFDSCTLSTYEGRIGVTRTRTVGSGKNRHTETYVVWRHISGSYVMNFNDVLVTAGSKFTQKQLDKISPFETDTSGKYCEEYLLGFMAYQYDCEIDECWNFAKARMDGKIRSGILSQYVYDRLDYLNVSTTHNGVTYKYVMLPVYVGNFRYKKKLYNFYINGRTGKVYGKTPKSPMKIGALVLSIAAVIGAAVALIMLL